MSTVLTTVDVFAGTLYVDGNNLTGTIPESITYMSHAGK